MVITVNDYEQIRKRFLAGESQRSIARSLGISRNTVRKYCEGGTVPWERKTPERHAPVVTGDVLDFIRLCLEEDRREGIKKQAHSAKRIYDRLVTEKGFTGGESTIRRAVREVKGTLPRAFVPLRFDPGQAMQVDWGEAAVYMGGTKWYASSAPMRGRIPGRGSRTLSGLPPSTWVNTTSCMPGRRGRMTNTTDEQVRILAKQLRFPTFADYQDVVRRAGPDAPFGRVLLSLMERELEQRQENNSRRRLKQAGFPYTKTLDDLDLSRYNGRISDIFVNELASCRFIDEKKNLVMVGNPGRGKTHTAIGIGLKACAAGMSVIFKNTAALSTELAEARDNYSLGRLEKRIQRADLLILDEMGYVSFDRYQSELLFRVVADRSERGSIIVTTNLPFSEWTTLFDNAAMVAALVDRLTFNSYILDMNGDSYRLEHARGNS